MLYHNTKNGSPAGSIWTSLYRSVNGITRKSREKADGWTWIEKDSLHTLCKVKSCGRHLKDSQCYFAYIAGIDIWPPKKSPLLWNFARFCWLLLFALHFCRCPLLMILEKYIFDCTLWTSLVSGLGGISSLYLPPQIKVLIANFSLTLPVVVPFFGLRRLFAINENLFTRPASHCSSWLIFLLTFWSFQGAHGPQEGAHQAPHERLYGLGPGSSTSHVQTVSSSAELGAKQIAGQAVEVSTSPPQI